MGFIASLVAVASLLVSTVTQAAIQYQTRFSPSNVTTSLPRLTAVNTRSLLFGKKEGICCLYSVSFVIPTMRWSLTVSARPLQTRIAEASTRSLTS